MQVYNRFMIFSTMNTNKGVHITLSIKAPEIITNRVAETCYVTGHQGDWWWPSAMYHWQVGETNIE